MSDKMLASIRRLAKVAKRDGRLYDTQMIIGFGVAADRGQGFDVFQPEDLDEHLALVSGLRERNAKLQIVYDELVLANNDLHGRNAELMSKLLQEDTEREVLRARVDALENRLEIDHVFVGEDMVRREVPPEERPNMVDGITARDSTIQNQEKKIAFQQTCLDNLMYKISQLEMDHAELAGLDAKCTALSVENAQLRYQIMHGIGSGGAGGSGGQPGEPGR